MRACESKYNVRNRLCLQGERKGRGIDRTHVALIRVALVDRKDENNVLACFESVLKYFPIMDLGCPDRL